VSILKIVLKKYNISVKKLAIFSGIGYTEKAVTLIAMKREVAAL